MDIISTMMTVIVIGVVLFMGIPLTFYYLIDKEK